MKKMLIFGYARVSTKSQKLDRQIKNIKDFAEREYGKDNAEGLVMYSEQFTGTKIDGRKALQNLLKRIEQLSAKSEIEIVLIIDEISRLARNSEEGIALYEKIRDMDGVTLIFLKERHLSTDVFEKTLKSQTINTDGMDENTAFLMNAVSEYLHRLARDMIVIAFQGAEKEVQLLHKRVSEGIEVARLNGKQIGRISGKPRIVAAKAGNIEKIKMYSKSFGGDLKDIDLVKMLNISLNTLYKYKKEIREQMEADNKLF